jgi:hypothetical protein
MNGSNLRQAMDHPDYGSSWLSSVPQANVRIIQSLGHDRFLTNPLYFTDHQWSYHSMLYNPDAYRNVNNPHKNKTARALPETHFLDKITRLHWYACLKWERTFSTHCKPPPYEGQWFLPFSGHNRIALCLNQISNRHKGKAVPVLN